MSAVLDFYCWRRWTTCRKAKEFLSQAGAVLNERDIFERPLSAEELAELARLIPADELFSWKSRSAQPYREMRGRVGEDELLRLMAGEPRLIRRPLTVRGGQAVAGFDRPGLEALLEG